MSRQEKRKELKKLKRKQQRQQAALLSAQQQEVEGDEEAVIRQERAEEEEALAKERAEHEEQERLWLLREKEARIEWLRKQDDEKQEAERKRQEEERRLQGEGGEEDLEEGWEYVEDGPAEIIWQGNEIIVKKPRKKIRKGTLSGTPFAIEQDKRKDGPISNPLPPQSVAFSSHQTDAQDVADQSSNFGTEKDQRNCPFYLKTGVCRFGVRCKRLHPVFNEACTLLMRSMYTGAGLALETVESLEYTDEEVVKEYEEFYEDVHSEFIQFGEIVNFKESAMAAYSHMNGRFYAKKQISCEFVGVHKWKLAICGEFTRTYYKTCSRGTACSFLHCFENPRREYEWADTDRPPPRFWQRKMAKLFGHAHVSDEEVDEKSRTFRESTHDTDHRGRHTDNKELVYDDRRRDRHMRDSAREDDQRRGRGDRERMYYYEDEMKDRTRRGSSKYNVRHSGRQSKEKSYDSRRDKDGRDFTYDDDSASHSKGTSYDSRRMEKDGRDSIYDEDSARRSMHRDEPGCINDERWIAGDDHLETDDMDHHRDRRRGRRHTSTAYDEYDDDDDGVHPGRYSPTADYVSHHRSHRYRPMRRSRSPSSHRVRRSRSRDRSTSHRARSVDGHHSSSEEQEEKYVKQTRHRKERASKEIKRHRHAAKGTGHDIHDSQLASDMLERRGNEVAEKSHSRKIHPENEHHQKASEMVESDDIRSEKFEGAVAGMVSVENASRSIVKFETQSGLLDVENLNQDTNRSSTGTVLSLDLSTDDVQKSTSEWQSWRKTKVKLGLKEQPMRLII